MDYLEFFGLKEDPFRMTPDSAYFYPSKEHTEILASLQYAIEQKEGFSLVVGEPGTGKTTILRILIENWKDRAEIALVMTPRLSPEEFLQAVLEDINVKLKKKNKNEMLKAFRDILIQHSAEGKRIIIIVDEAQNVPDETIEELRLLSNLETEKEKLLQIILMGQPELKKKLEAAHLKQLNQRITIRAILKPLTRSETSDYINFRLIKAGKGTIAFDDDARKKIYRMSKGIPRLINIIASRSLMAAFVSGSESVNKDHVKYAIEHIAGESPSPWIRKIHWVKYGVLALAVIILAAIGLYRFSGITTARVPASTATVVPAQSAGEKNIATSGSHVPAQEPVRWSNESRANAKEAGQAAAPAAGAPPQVVSKKYVTIVTSSANMRSAPDVGSEQVAWATRGATFPVLEQIKDKTGKTWYRVQHPNGRECWVSKKVVTEKPGDR